MLLRVSRRGAALAGVRRAFVHASSLRSAVVGGDGEEKGREARKAPEFVRAATRPDAEALSAEWTPFSKRTGLLAIKCGMRTEYDANGNRIPVTVLQVDQCQVVQVKTRAHDGVDALQVGCSTPKLKRVAKPTLLHCISNGVPPKKELAEFPITPDAALPAGTELTAGHFLPGQFVDVTGKNKGKGFAGAMKRWGFAGQGASHGVSKTHRAIGSTGGCQDPGRVWPGKKMPGHMGARKKTTQNLRVFKVDQRRNLIYVKGAVPGPVGAFLRVRDAVRKPHKTAPPFPTCDAAAVPDVAFAEPERDVASRAFKEVTDFE